MIASTLRGVLSHEGEHICITYILHLHMYIKMYIVEKKKKQII